MQPETCGKCHHLEQETLQSGRAGSFVCGKTESKAFVDPAYKSSWCPIREKQLDEIQRYVDEVNSHFSAVAMSFDRTAVVTDADIDRHLDLIWGIARCLEPASTARC